MTDSDASALRLLIADDSALTRTLIRGMVENDLQVDEASDGKEALAAYRNHHPDIILLDIKMPVMDGLDVITAIRDTHNDADTFIIVLTADDAPHLHNTSLNAGANDFLSKPIRKAEIMARLGVAVRQMLITRRLREYTARIQQEIELVASLQQKLLPASSPLFPGIAIESVYRASGQASGDYFDYFALADDKTLRVVVADVSGHGARAAFIMGIVRTLFRMTRNTQQSLGETVHAINTHLLEIIGKEEDFVTLLCADIDTLGNTLEYVNAGHCPGILRTGDGTRIELASTTSLLGFFAQPIQTHTCPFTPGSRLFLYTDGFFDWRMANGERFSFEMFRELAVRLLDMPNSYVTTLEHNIAELAKGTDGFRDDITGLWIVRG